MRTYFTADAHFQHGNIIRYTKRPWVKPSDLDAKGQWISKEIENKRIEKMNKTIINNFNQKLKDGDKIYHIGDFCFKGGKEASGKTKAQYFESLINAPITHILGNHDGNNGIKAGLESATIRFANKTFFLVHRPPLKPSQIPQGVDAVLCGHVHNNWKHKWCGAIPIINIGVDVWNFNLVSTQDVAVYYEKMMRESGRDPNPRATARQKAKQKAKNKAKK